MSKGMEPAAHAHAEADRKSWPGDGTRMGKLEMGDRSPPARDAIHKYELGQHSSGHEGMNSVPGVPVAHHTPEPDGDLHPCRFGRGSTGGVKLDRDYD